MSVYYEALLIKYMALVSNEEGVDFVSRAPESRLGFEDSEIVELWRISNESKSLL